MTQKYYFKGIDMSIVLDTTIQNDTTNNPGGSSFLGFPNSAYTTATFERPLTLNYKINGADLCNSCTAMSDIFNNNSSAIGASTPQKLHTINVPTGVKYISAICVGGGGGGGHGGRGYYNGFNGTAHGGNGGDGGIGNYSAVSKYYVNPTDVINCYVGGGGCYGINDNDDGFPGTESKVVINNVTICTGTQGNGGFGGNDGSQNGNSNGNNGGSGTNTSGSHISSCNGTNDAPISFNVYPPQLGSYGIAGVGGNYGNKSGGNQGTSGTSGYVKIYYYYE